MSIPCETRRESYRRLEPGTRRQQILWALERYGPLTARECAAALGYSDLNAVRPRLTELYKQGLVETTGKRIDKLTALPVTEYRIKEGKRNGETGDSVVVPGAAPGDEDA